MCPDRINDLIILPVNDSTTGLGLGTRITPVLGCNDRVLRILEESNQLYEAEVAGPPVTLSLLYNTGGPSGREIIYDTSDGKIGAIELGLDEPIPKWELPNTKKMSGVSCLDNYDITNDGTVDLIVSREDGVVEVYSYDSMDNLDLKYSYVNLLLKQNFLNLFYLFYFLFLFSF